MFSEDIKLKLFFKVEKGLQLQIKLVDFTLNQTTYIL